MKIYTKTGDSGTTGLFGGPRVAKDDCRIEAYGTVDELNAVIGLVRHELASESDSDDQMPNADRIKFDDQLAKVQHELFSLGAELATPQPDEYSLRVIDGNHVERIEGWIDEAEQTLPPLKQFILPGGTAVASHLHVARAVCRRAERRVITLSDSLDATEAEISAALVVYLNRLSDWLFVASRYANHVCGKEDHPWVKPSV